MNEWKLTEETQEVVVWHQGQQRAFSRDEAATGAVDRHIAALAKKRKPREESKRYPVA